MYKSREEKWKRLIRHWQKIRFMPCTPVPLQPHTGWSHLSPQSPISVDLSHYPGTTLHFPSAIYSPKPLFHASLAFSSHLQYFLPSPQSHLKEVIRRVGGEKVGKVRRPYMTLLNSPQGGAIPTIYLHKRGL